MPWQPTSEHLLNQKGGAGGWGYTDTALWQRCAGWLYSKEKQLWFQGWVCSWLFPMPASAQPPFCIACLFSLLPLGDAQLHTSAQFPAPLDAWYTSRCCLSGPCVLWLTLRLWMNASPTQWNPMAVRDWSALICIFPEVLCVCVCSCWQNDYLEKPNSNEGLHDVQCKSKYKNNSSLVAVARSLYWHVKGV